MAAVIEQNFYKETETPKFFNIVKEPHKWKKYSSNNSYWSVTEYPKPLSYINMDHRIAFSSCFVAI